MLIYKDIFSGDELISDAYDIKEVGGVLYEVDCKMITIKKGGGDVDIGANASAEEAAEDLDDSTERVNDIIHAFRLVTASNVFDKKSYHAYLTKPQKGKIQYMKRLLGHLDSTGTPKEEIKAFSEDAKKAYLLLKAKLDKAKDEDFEYYVGESGSEEGMVVLMSWRDDQVTPYLTFWKHGLKAEKY